MRLSHWRSTLLLVAVVLLACTRADQGGGGGSGGGSAFGGDKVWFDQVHVAPTADGAGIAWTWVEVAKGRVPEAAEGVVHIADAADGEGGARLAVARRHTYRKGGFNKWMFEVMVDMGPFAHLQAVEYVLGLRHATGELVWDERTRTVLGVPIYARGRLDAQVAAYASWAHGACRYPRRRSIAPPASVGKMVIGLVADTSVSDAAHTTVAAMAASEPSLDLVLHLGDFGYADTTDNVPWSVARKEYGELKQEYWDRFFRMIEPLARQVPMLAIPGNHEAGSHDGKSGFDYHFIPYLSRFFNPSDPRRVALRDAIRHNRELVTWYKVALSPLVTLIALNSDEDLGPDSAQGSFALQALAEEAARGPRHGAFTLVLIHRSAYSA